MKRGFTLPSAQTASAKSARSAFFCALCQKGYTRMNEFEAHESSYDHLHKKRLKEMKEMQRQVGTSTNKGREEKGPLVKIQLGGRREGEGAKAGGFKKGGFKSAFGPVEDEEVTKEVVVDEKMEREDTKVQAEDSDVTDEEDYYDPRRPTGCTPDCAGKMNVSGG